MKKLVMIAVVALLLAGTAQAGIYAASASTDNTVTVSGSWTVSHYKSDGCYSGTNCGSDAKSRAEGSDPINLSTTYTCANGAAASSLKVDATPKITISSDANVHDVLMPSGHWAMGYSQGGANWLLSAQTGTITVTCDWSYALDLMGAANDPNSEAYAMIYVGFWAPRATSCSERRMGLSSGAPIWSRRSTSRDLGAAVPPAGLRAGTCR